MRAALAIVIALTVAACGGSTYSYSCSGSGCEVTTSGKAKVDLLDVTLAVRSTSGETVTLRAGSQEATLKAGETKTLGPLRVNVKSVSDDDVKLHVERA